MAGDPITEPPNLLGETFALSREMLFILARLGNKLLVDTAEELRHAAYEYSSTWSVAERKLPIGVEMESEISSRFHNCLWKCPAKS